MRPRKWLSWSALSLWESSVEAWKEKYLYGKEMPVSRAMAFGKTMAEGLEHGEMTGDAGLDLMMEKLPKFEVMDKEFMTELPGKKVYVPILCKPDSMKKDMSAFIEYKTGVARWSKRRVDDAGQLTFYATGMYLETGKIPQSIELVHVETETDVAGRVSATGQIFRHPTKRDMRNVLAMMVRMKKAWAAMEKVADAELA